MKVIRLKDIRRREERIRTVNELVGASSSSVDPTTEKDKNLWKMFGLSA